MSDTDSFIDEVTEEVRRDRLFALMRRYGWIAIVIVLLLVGGTAWNELRKGQARQSAEAFGDSILGALEENDRAARVSALGAIDAPGADSKAVLDLLTASEQGEDAPDAAAKRLLALADNNEIALIYRQIATLKAVAIPDAGISADTRSDRLQGLTLAGGIIRLLAEEQLALIDVENGETQAAIDRFSQIVVDSEATAGLRRRASQVIVALGGDLPEIQPGE